MKRYEVKGFLAGGILALSVFFIEIVLVTGATLAPTAPTLSRVESTTDGYALVGSGFGTDRNQIQVFEDSTQVPATAVVTVANNRIEVRSRPTSTVELKVVVGRLASGVVRFTHAVVRDAAKAKADEEARKKAEAAVKVKAEEEAKRKAAQEAKAKVVFQPKKITTGELVMTGLRFQPKKITTGELTMTGLRE